VSIGRVAGRASHRTAPVARTTPGATSHTHRAGGRALSRLLSAPAPQLAVVEGETIAISASGEVGRGTVAVDGPSTITAETRGLLLPVHVDDVFGGASQDALRSRHRGSASLRWLLVGLDAAALLASWAPYAFGDRASLARADPDPTIALVTAMRVTTLVSLLVAATRRLYRSRVASIKEHERALLVSVAVASAVAGGISLHYLGARPSLGLLAGDAVLAFALLVAERSAYRSWLKVQRQRGRYVRPTLIVGNNEEGRYWADIFAQHPELGVDVRGIVGEKPDETHRDDLASTAPRDTDGDCPPPVADWLGPYDETTRIAAAVGATGVFVMSTAFSAPELRRVVRELMRSDLHVQLSMGMLGLAHGRLTITTVSHENLLYLEQRSLSPRSLALKRMLDLVLGTAILAASAPVIAVAAFLIRREDGGDVLFRQKRIGHNGKPFTLYKLRTMSADAEQRKDELLGENMRLGPLFKANDDPRVTRIGRLLRLTSLDELPQLFNVLLGEMSLVGPRPALPEEVEQFDAELLLRHDVLPGITGLWQVEGRDDASFDSYHRLDLHYVENWSLLLDLSILVSTVAALVARTLRAALAVRTGEEIAI
jgi:exopolysaccharide biosynthesis polyprenyl glycosylphosphotransferase